MLMNNNEYIKIIETIKGEIRGAQYKAALSVNRELIMLYYHIGTVINEHILIVPHLKGMVGEIVDLRQGNVPDFCQLCVVPFLLRGEQVIERVRGKREVALSACHRLTPPS